MSALISGPVATRYGLLAPAGLSWPRLLLTTIISALAIALAALAGLSEREVALVALLPWLIYLGLQLPIVVRSMPWLAPWLALLLGQALHLIEHAVQMAQLHILQLPPSSAHGVVGALDIEWVHLIWNTFVLGATILLLTGARANRWLLALVALAGVHEIEHVYLTWNYAQGGLSGAPGLFASGGALAGGLPIARPDLHFIYNLAELIVFAIALSVQLRMSTEVQLALRLRHRHEPGSAIGPPQARSYSEVH